MTLHLLHLPVRSRLLWQCARDSGLVTDHGSADLGYLMHGLFKRLAEKPPAPFDVQPGGGLMPVLAYSGGDIAAFRAEAEARRDEAGLAAIDWAHARSKPMPDLGTGHVLGFRVRVCPVVRIGRHHPRLQPGAEIDPYVALLQRRLGEHLPGEPDADPPPALRSAVVATLPPREAVYRDWLEARIGDAARLTAARLVAQRDATLWRKGTPKPGPAAQMYDRPRARHGRRAVIGRREAVFEGRLQVADAAAFAGLLARGVGRHRAFGFGMLLLRSVADAEG
jgi:CRISPR system Cascade subunit CasE